MFTQRYAVDVFRRYKRTRLRLPEFINSENVWMIEIRDGARFLRKALQAIFVFRNFSRHDLERHSPAQFRSILRQVNLAHPARPQLRADFVTTKLCAGRNGHVCGPAESAIKYGRCRWKAAHSTRISRGTLEEFFSLLPLREGLGMRVYGAILFLISTAREWHSTTIGKSIGVSSLNPHPNPLPVGEGELAKAHIADKFMPKANFHAAPSLT